MAAIKGFAWALSKPVVEVPTLDTLARNIFLIPDPASRGLVVPVIDAKRNLIYTAFYKIDKSGLKRITPFMLLNQTEFLAKLKSKTLRKGCVIFGDALNVHRQVMQAGIRGACFLDKDHYVLSPGNLLTLGRELIKDKKITNPFDIEPIYLYPKECQIKGKHK